MSQIQNILVATDFSVASERALETAIALATRFRAGLTVLHVVEESAYAFPFPIPQRVRDAASARLDEVVEGVQARFLSVNGVVREGIAWYEICSAASALAPQVVVIGSQGRRGLPRFVIGSVAERVVRQSPVPVLTIHPTDHVAILAGGMDRFRQILVPTDFSEAAERGIDVAVSLALEFNALLTVVHAFEPPGDDYGTFEGPELERRARSELDVLAQRIRVRVPTADAILRNGYAWRAILDVAEERGSDLIVLSTHGRHGFQRALIGSVAEKIVRLSVIPVWTIGSKECVSHP
jgi:nucleotide-binding universal stress UspA family protein